MKKINPKWFARRIVPLGFIIVFAAVGVYFLAQSDAANDEPVYVSHILTSSVGDSTKYTVSDNVSGFGTSKVVQLTAGAFSEYPGQGALSKEFVKKCYLVKPVDGDAVVQFWGLNSLEQTKLKAGVSKASYQEFCTSKTRKKPQTYPGFDVKVLSGKVNIFYIATHFRFVDDEVFITN